MLWSIWPRRPVLCGRTTAAASRFVVRRSWMSAFVPAFTVWMRAFRVPASSRLAFASLNCVSAALPGPESVPLCSACS